MNELVTNKCMPFNENYEAKIKGRESRLVNFIRANLLLFGTPIVMF